MIAERAEIQFADVYIRNALAYYADIIRSLASSTLELL